MTVTRRQLPGRRAAETFGFRCNSLDYTATISFFSTGELAEIFLSNSKAGSHSDSAAKDSAVVCSIALQYGGRSKLSGMRCCATARGVASGPLGCALDIIAGGAP